MDAVEELLCRLSEEDLGLSECTDMVVGDTILGRVCVSTRCNKFGSLRVNLRRRDAKSMLLATQ